MAPTDREIAAEFGDDAIVNGIPESCGADILIYTQQGVIGVQRKHVPEDFIASMNDGRLTRETSLLKEMCDFSILLLEGKIDYFPDGTVKLNRKFPGRYTRSGIEAALWSIKYVKHIDYDRTENIADTVRYCRHMFAYFNDSEHLGLFHRPKAQGNWITPSASDIQLWLLQSFDGVGPKLANEIIKHFGGKLPMQMTCSVEELRKVPRLGKKADEIFEIMNHAAMKTVSGIPPLLGESYNQTVARFNAEKILQPEVVEQTREEILASLRALLG